MNKLYFLPFTMVIGVMTLKGLEKLNYVSIMEKPSSPTQRNRERPPGRLGLT
jgi:hypothetical protein